MAAPKSGFGSTKATSDKQEAEFLKRAIDESIQEQKRVRLVELIQESEVEHLVNYFQKSNPDYARQHASQERLKEYVEWKKIRLKELNKILGTEPEGSAIYLSALEELSKID